DAVAADEELAFHRLRFAVLIEHDLDASVLPSGRLRLGPEERVRAFTDRVRRDRSVEHRPLDDDRFRVVPIDHELSSRRGVELRPMHGADDRLLAVHVVEDAGRDEAAALNGLPDLPVLLDEGDLVSRGRDLPREISSRRARADHDDVEGACGGDHVPASLLQIHDDLEEVLEDPRLRDDRVHELRLALGPKDLVEQVELAERVLQMVDDAPLHLAGRLRLEDRRPAAGRNREAFLAEALEDLVRRGPRDMRRLRDRLRAAVTVRDERDVSAGLVSGKSDRLEGLRGPLELLLQVHSLGEELRQVLRNHGARYLRTPLY